MPSPRYIIGIDLGTSNTVVSYAKADVADGVTPQFQIFEIPQVAKPGVVEKHPLLPSFLLLSDAEAEEKGSDLSWDQNGPVVGIYARERGVEVPAKLITSSKSWLCTDLVDREAEILPWDSSSVEKKLSPVTASAAILSHVKNAWNEEFARDDSESRMEDQDIFLTVPASFDAVARELTVRAAKEAGLEQLTLLEEPQAAFYSWLSANQEHWREQVHPGDTILVCDVGGGTSDFTLIRVEDADGNLALERIAVGNHLLVGGDNMDLALAYTVAGRLAAKKQKLDHWQMRGLIQRCRQVKETLMRDPEKESIPISILGRGSGLIGGTIRTELTSQDVRQVLLAGFFPSCDLTAKPANTAQSGLSEFGLAYESDPAVTHHLADFVSRNPESGPTAVLFNGGVMKPDLVRKEVCQTLSSWNDHQDVRELDNGSYDLSVAQGAAYYGWARKGEGIRIKSGLNKSYYISVSAAMPAIPGIPMPTKALCLAPFGMEEGTETTLTEKVYALTVGAPVSFSLLSSASRHGDLFGETVEDWEGEIEPLTTIETSLDGNPGDRIPVCLHVKATEIGTLEFFCMATEDDREWKLAFSVREQPAAHNE